MESFKIEISCDKNLLNKYKNKMYGVKKNLIELLD
jgi:hypothetical protein